MVRRGYAFHPKSSGDPPVQRRPAAARVARWWGDPRRQYALAGDDLDHPAADRFVVAIDGRPSAYPQWYDLTVVRDA